MSADQATVPHFGLVDPYGFVPERDACPSKSTCQICERATVKPPSEVRL